MPAGLRPRILIADDEPAILDSFVSVLGRDRSLDHSSKAEANLEAELFGDPVSDYPLSFDLTLCRQGDEAIDAIRKSIETTTPFQVAFLDVRMPPGINGIEAAEQIRALDPNINIVFVTGFSDIHPREIRKRVPPGDKYLFCQKPLKNVELEQLAHTLSAKWEAEAALKSASARLGLLVGSSPAVIYSCKLGGDFEATFVSENIKALLGYEPREFLDDPGFWLAHIHPDDKPRIISALEEALQGQSALVEYRFQRKDGGYSWMRDGATIVHDVDGRPIELIGYFIDITEVKKAEERLQQALKMEAVGQLTGGVAHDFNNLLAVIMGNTELLEDRLGSEDKSLEAILRAVTRGSELTQRLLAFSRQQPLRPQAIDLGVLVSGMSELLIRTLGETMDIETSAAPGLWDAVADSGQVENALLNLALNARDAMPGGGKLTITCENAHLDEAYVARNPEVVAGDYVALAVCDNGTGMSTEVRAKVFEPFYTTKDVGKGSGLGLSMVYGFAKQSGGHVTIYSELDRGTTVKLYLPRAQEEAQSKVAQKDPDIPRGRDEVILVIEDDPDVRELAVRLLNGLGYRMIEAVDVAEARMLLARGARVDLVLSDVILPGGISGPEFAENARMDYPDLKIIFMSGYPAEAIERNNFLDSDNVLLNKPFQRQQLAKALRDALS